MLTKISGFPVSRLSGEVGDILVARAHFTQGGRIIIRLKNIENATPCAITKTEWVKVKMIIRYGNYEDEDRRRRSVAQTGRGGEGGRTIPQH